MTDGLIRMLHFVAGCHASDTRESLRMAKRSAAPSIVATRCAAAAYSAALAWKVARSLESRSTPDTETESRIAA